MQATRACQHPARHFEGHVFQKLAPTQQRTAGGRVENHFAGPKAMAFGNAGVVEINETRFGAGNDQAVVRYRVAHRAKPIPIEFHAYRKPITEDHCGGAVPWLAFLRKNFQRRAHVGGEKRILVKGRGNQSEHGSFDAFPFEKLQLEGIVEAGRVADLFFEQAEPLPYPDALANFALACAHPAAITDDRVDLAVVRDVAERLRELPRRLRVRRVTLMENRELGREFGVMQVFVETGELPGREQPFVNHGARREGAEITALGQSLFGALAKKGETALEFRGELGSGTAGVGRLDKELPDFGQALEGALTKAIGVHRNAAPADQTELAATDGVFDGRTSIGNARGRYKEHAHAEGFVETDFFFGCARAEEFHGKAGQKAGAVTAGAIGIDTTAMGKALEGLQGVNNDFVGGRAAELRDEAGAAGIPVRVPPVGVARFLARDAIAPHTSLIVGARTKVQCRIFL